MNVRDAMEQALAQARELQRQIGEAAEKAAEIAKPQVEQSLATARELQETLNKHAVASSEIASKQAQSALGYLGDFMKLGSEALRESTAQTQKTVASMIEQSRKIADAAAEAVKKTREG
ncbi:MAG: hypothetical protein ACREM2_06195 [Vulcanimicrobiaceae bacterium]